MSDLPQSDIAPLQAEPIVVSRQDWLFLCALDKGGVTLRNYEKALGRSRHNQSSTKEEAVSRDNTTRNPQRCERIGNVLSEATQMAGALAGMETATRPSPTVMDYNR